MEWINNSRSKLNWGNISLALLALLGIIVTTTTVASVYVRLRGGKSITENNLISNIVSPPVKTNSWFSSLYKFPTEPVYIHPLVVKFEENGMSFSYPPVLGAENTVSASFENDCIITFGENVYGHPEVQSYSDWQVRIKFSENNNIILTKGLPFVYIKGDNLSVACSANQKNYVIQTKDGEMRIAAIFDGDEESKTILENADWSIPTSTEVRWAKNSDMYITKYIFKGLSENSYLVLYPHQYNNLTEDFEEIGTYKTALGYLKVIKANKFSTKVFVPELRSNFSRVENPEYQNQIVQAINQDIEKFSTLQFPQGVYFKGTMLGALSSLSQLAAIYNSERLEDVLNILEFELTTSLKQFEYSKDKKMLISRVPEFGNEEGNDHHFHYGYYIRAAAILENYRPSNLDDKKIIDEMVNDIASLASDKYPRLRTFSIYEGHSWADGDAGFADGNNQESTSEALNAWYAISLWGGVNKNTDLVELGNWLYSQELVSTRTYWFGELNPFPDGYNHKIASIIWGAKRDFATWFSGETMHIYGIQLLPITPASTYHLETISGKEYIDEIEDAYPSPSRHEWGDLYVSYLSFHDPMRAVSLVSSVNSIEGMKLKSLLLQTVFERAEKLEATNPS